MTFIRTMHLRLPSLDIGLMNFSIVEHQSRVTTDDTVSNTVTIRKRHRTCRIPQNGKPPVNNIPNEERKALQDIRGNQNLIVLRADKGNATGVMDRQDYNMVIQMLLDTDHYKKLNKGPITKVGKQTRDAIKESSIPKEEERRLLPLESRLPRLNTKSFVKNSEHFIEILQQHEIRKEDLLISFDVESLFTNVPMEATTDTKRTTAGSD
ncbi:hypothetical protein Trydic_g16760 [Trypoxylus dichotomus]